MSWRIMKRRTRLDVVRGILVVGLVSAVGVFLTAVNPADNPLGNPLEDSKAFRRSMEIYGGTSNVVASELRESLQSLWHGKSLAFTLAVITLGLAYGFFFITEDLPSEKR